MQLTVKDLKSVSNVFSDVDPEQTVGQFSEKVKEVYKYPEGVRLIYSGRILDHSKKLNEYFQEMNTGFVVCMPEKKPAPVQASIPASVPASVPAAPAALTAPTAPTSTPTSSDNTNTTYTLDQVRAMMLVFARFMKASPDVFYMFSTNDAQFQQFMLSPIFMSGVLQPLALASTSIQTAITNGTDVSVPIPIFGQTNFTGPTINTPDAPSTNTGSINANSTLTDLSDNLFTLSQNSENTTLTQEDHLNINELSQLGFDKSLVTQTYIMSGKNKELTASMLFEFM